MRLKNLLSEFFNRTIKKRAKIVLPNKYLGWLGINPNDLALRLKRFGVEVCPLNAETGLYAIDEVKSCPKVLNDALYYAVAVENEVTSFDLNSDFPTCVNKWQLYLVQMLRAIEKEFHRSRPDLVVLIQGYEPVNSALRAAAINLEIPLLSIENTAMSNRMLWDDISGITTNRNLAKNYYWKYKGLVSEESVHYFHKTLVKNFHHSKSSEHTAPSGNQAPICDKPSVLFLGQVLTDSSIIFGLGRWQSPLDVIEATARWCLDKGYRLIVKLHPKESMGNNPITNEPYNRLTYRKIQERGALCNLLKENQAVVDFENGLDTYMLIDQCQIAVTVNSQSGLEAALLGKPVVVSGNAFYDGLGFTIESSDPRIFSLVMEDAINYSVPRSASEFSYIFYEFYCRPKSVDGLSDLILEHI
ncbi:MAG: polysialyltransferase family glycosyltransferase [Desulfobacterales bacterium]